MDNDWKPISPADFRVILTEEELRLGPEDRQKYEMWRVPFGTRGSLTRSEAYGEESVFVVARAGRTVVFFEDVEDEFGLGSINDGGVILCVGLMGELCSALHELPGGTP
ncbi:MAG: hypothetical protein NT049_09420 [Planctomycetota bacterium]|nr:hypothetical protein [Planctomycetota bacterium]